MKLSLILILITFILLIFFIKYTSSLPSSFTTSRTCTDTFGSPGCADHDINDALLGCDGADTTTSCYVTEVYINQTSFFPGTEINVTCDFHHGGNINSSEYIWYYNGSDWYNILNQSNFSTSSRDRNVSVSFKLNSTSGTHIARCMVDCVIGSGAVPIVSGECANSTYTTATRYDNDDVNFTVADYPRYDFWNLTNITGADVSGQTFNRTNSTGHTIYLNVSAHWTDNITYAFLEHNGTGTLTNYTISSITANWTNITLNLSDASLFNRKNITLTIYANNSYGLENKTSARACTQQGKQHTLIFS